MRGRKKTYELKGDEHKAMSEVKHVSQRKSNMLRDVEIKQRTERRGRSSDALTKKQCAER